MSQVNRPITVACSDRTKKPIFDSFVATAWLPINCDPKIGQQVYLRKATMPDKYGNFSFFVNTDVPGQYRFEGIDPDGRWIMSYVGMRSA
jgi:hypothetical protein